MSKVSLTVNGKEITADVEDRTLLVHFLREVADLTATNIGCETTSCGACTVLLDGESVKSCTVLALQADGRPVTTLEGLAGRDGSMSPVQEAFHRNHGLQCGYCTPGFVMAITSLLAENPAPTEAEVRAGLEGNICRCTGYHNIVKAALAAASAMVASGTVASGTVASGTVASGTVASGTVASGTVAAGTVASGTVASGTVASGTGEASQ